MHKSKKKIYLEKILRWMSIVILKKYNPRIIGITGSVGKTSTKEAVFSVLAAQFRVRRNEKNYNNEIGIPLTIIGAKSGESSILGWLGVFLEWLLVAIFPFEYPEILILEMGADKPGDMEYLTEFIHLDVAIITDVSPSHIEFFQTLENIAKEKGTIVKSLKEDGLAILNADNKYVMNLKNQTKAGVVSCGFSNDIDFQATDIAFAYNDDRKKEIRGLTFKLSYEGTSIPIRLNNVLAKHQVYSALMAIAVGIKFNINLVEIATALESFAPPCGRMNLLKGIKNTLLIDDSYNASPVSVCAALEVLGEIQAKRKIVVLGDMLELGVETERGHQEVAQKFLKTKGDIFMAVGPRIKIAVEELKKKNFPLENIFYFSDPMTAGLKLQEIMKEGDLVLVKGSQGARMEKVLEEVIFETLLADEILCRQNKSWKEKPFALN